MNSDIAYIEGVTTHIRSSKVRMRISQMTSLGREVLNTVHIPFNNWTDIVDNISKNIDYIESLETNYITEINNLRKPETPFSSES